MDTLLRRITLAAALLVGAVSAHAQTYTGTLYPSSSPVGLLCTVASCTFTAPIIGTAATFTTGVLSTGATGTLGFNVSNTGAQYAGMRGDGSGGIIFRNDSGFAAATNFMNMSTNLGIQITSTYQWAWSSAVAGAAANDTGLARDAAGVIKVTNGSSGEGAIKSKVFVYANNGALGLATTHSGTYVSNTGDSDASTVGLVNDPAVGIQYTVAATVAQDITITAAAGETLMFGNTACGTSLVVGGAATGIGDSVTITAMSGGSGAIWVVTAFAGTPVCTP